ncbi:MAG: nuclear transport factor 2 family protein [Rhodospirillales bacterium]|nr:nuclear transport factor 2 family protein [Rhodospirillales bacterium]
MATQATRPAFTAIRREMWEPLLQVADAPVGAGASVEARLARIEDEMAVRDLLVKYAYSYDANDIEGVMSVFHPDVVLVNPRGTFIGADAVRRNYQHLLTTRRYSFHHVTNVTVRFSEDRNEALASSYWTDKHVGRSGSIDGSDGTYLDRVVRSGDEWKIIELRITANIFYVMTPLPDPWPPLPEPSKQEGTREWVGPTYVR